MQNLIVRGPSMGPLARSRVDFNQGLDARLITPETAGMLARLHWIRFIRLSCDTSAMLSVIRQATAYLREAGAAPSRLWSYVLVRDVAEAHRIVTTLRDMGVTPFAQPYRRSRNRHIECLCAI